MELHESVALDRCDSVTHKQMDKRCADIMTMKQIE